MNTSMQVAALTNIARLIAEDDELPPVKVSVERDGRVSLASFYADSGERMSVDEARNARDVWARVLGLDERQSVDGSELHYFEAHGMWAACPVSVASGGVLAAAGSVTS